MHKGQYVVFHGRKSAVEFKVVGCWGTSIVFAPVSNLAALEEQQVRIYEPSEVEELIASGELQVF